MNPWLFSIPLAYLLGSIPFGYLLVRFVRKQDIRDTGSGNIGATNVLRSGAKGIAFATLLLDTAKTLVPILIARILIARHLAPADPNLPAAAAIAAMLGYVFPVWLGFRGGKGVAGGLGVFLGLCWPAGLCVLGVFIVALALSRFVSLASILAAASLPVFAFLFVPHPAPAEIAAFFFVPAIIILRHYENIRRLLAGTESRIGQKAAA